MKMSLNWSWNNKCGEAVFEGHFGDKVEQYTQTLYQGNALLIFLYEDEKQYCLKSFFADREHARRCLGIPKKGDKEVYENLYTTGFDKLKSIKLYRDKVRKGELKELVSLFAQADFDELTIELVNSPEYEKKHDSDDVIKL